MYNECNWRLLYSKGDDRSCRTITKKRNMKATTHTEERSYPAGILGIKEIPMYMIAGTKTVGRQNSFASNFMPLMDLGTEFSYKWSTLYDSAIEDGIREPIKVYEFMNKFYVEEGNKRVSVSKFIGYVSISGNVLRILPPKDGSAASRINYEYIDFYNVTGFFEITFSKTETLRYAYATFDKCYNMRKTRKLSITVGDAFLLYLEVYDVESLMHDTESVIGHKIQRLWNELVTQTQEDSIELVRTPDEVGRGSSMTTLMTLNSAYTDKPIRVAFLFEKNEEESSWAYGHSSKEL